jgi:hypothetical protein
MESGSGLKECIIGYEGVWLSHDGPRRRPAPIAGLSLCGSDKKSSARDDLLPRFNDPSTRRLSLSRIFRVSDETPVDGSHA